MAKEVGGEDVRCGGIRRARRSFSENKATGGASKEGPKLCCEKSLKLSFAKGPLSNVGLCSLKRM